MKLKDAIKVLIKHAGRDAGGTGTGIRSAPTPDEMRELTAAVRVAWKYAYGWESSNSDLTNYGFRS
jgi:hypothetical protein